MDGPYRTLLNLTSSLFKNVVPSVTSITVTSSDSAGATAVSIESKVWRYALRYLQAIAAYHPSKLLCVCHSLNPLIVCVSQLISSSPGTISCQSRSSVMTNCSNDVRG